MSALPFAFVSPAILFALLALPIIWWLLRLTPPRPRAEVFPPLKILASVLKREETPAQSPWWLTLLRMLMAAAVILAIADPIVNPRTNTVVGTGPMVLLIDNGWATAADWERRVATAEALIGDAESTETPIAIAFTADQSHDAIPGTAAAAREKLAAAAPRPIRPDRVRAVDALRAALSGTRPGTLAFVSDGMKAGETDQILSELASLNPSELRLIEGDGQATMALTGASNTADAMAVTATRLNASGPARLALSAEDNKGRMIAAGSITFAPGETQATGAVTAPFEMRNDFARLTIDGQATAGSTYLLDDGFKRRRVALLAGEASDAFQPLLSPLYYIRRALQPYADLVEPDVTDLSVSIPELLGSNPSVIIMADIGRLPAETYEPVERWIANGGTLIRFAGPRLAAAPAEDPLVPVILRQGERALGGALSWAEPQPLADFPPTGPFAGMAKPDEIRVKRQVLAEPTPDLAERTWASLADGTPLVTVKELNSGRIVLFHVTAEATWSDLPISGHFVEMLRRIVQVSKAGGATSTNADSSNASEALPPYRLLSAKGVLTAETGTARPLDLARSPTPVTSFDNPPGLYGSEDGFVALNLLPAGTVIAPLDAATAGMAVRQEGLVGGEAWSAKPALFSLAFLLLMLDSLIVLFMNGALSFARPAARTLGLTLALSGLVALPHGEARADDSKQNDGAIFDRLDTTHLAYVKTGENDVDDISQRGLAGLSEFIMYRTTLEPGDPVGVDISADELSFFPLIYWPVSASAPMPTNAAISRIDAYMRSGGTVLFDTRDQFGGLSETGMVSANGERLREILANLDIPPLEPVPADHVLTKSFYLLSNFPGRYNGGQLWVEARQDPRNGNTPASASADGVTPIMITSNDFAGAWAVDRQGTPLLPMVPPDEIQRDYAFRTGVNIMMYMLTGNYKTDQVHVPALLERLGQ